MRGPKLKKPEASIPIAAMADIAMLLVIFFLVTSTFEEDYGLQMEIPDAKDKPVKQDQQKHKQVDIDKRGKITFRGRYVSLEKLDALLRGAVQDAEKEDDKLVLVVASKSRPVNEIAAVADIIKGAGGVVVLVNQEGADTPTPPGKVKAMP